MTSDRIESILDIRFPGKWKDIHSTGVMEWMEQSIREFRENKEKYINDPKQRNRISYYIITMITPAPYWKQILLMSLYM